MTNTRAQRAAKAYNTTQKKKYPLLAATGTLSDVVPERTEEEAQARRNRGQLTTQMAYERRQIEDAERTRWYIEKASAVLGYDKTLSIVAYIMGNISRGPEYVHDALNRAIARATNQSPLDAYYWLRGEPNPHRIYMGMQEAKRPKEVQGTFELIDDEPAV